jgi:hypothetical protein
LIFAILQLAAGLEHDYSPHEHIWLINDALALQQVRNVPNAQTTRNIDQFILGKWARRFESLLADEQCGANRNCNHDQRREDRVADYHNGMPYPARVALGCRYSFGFEGGARASGQRRLGYR